MIQCSRGPSRILWFLIGAVTTGWLLKPKDADSRIFGHCMRLQVQTPPPSFGLDGTHFTPSAPNSWPNTVRNIPRAINHIPPAQWVDERQPWQQEKEHLVIISRKVTDAMTDLTEATLESVLSATEALRAKLAEHRVNREQQQSIIEQQIQDSESPPSQ